MMLWSHRGEQARTGPPPNDLFHWKRGWQKKNRSLSSAFTLFNLERRLCLSWEMPGHWDILWMKGLMLYIESH